MTEIVDDISKTLDSKSINCSVFVDLAKAFNTINHGILLDKLEKYGIRGLPLKLIKTYLLDRRQVTVVNSLKSEEKVLNVGVPQGSSLGPLLFIVYVNDLPLVSNFKVRLFADDMCLSFSEKDPAELNSIVNKELEKVYHWLKCNKLFINYKKSTYLIFDKSRKKHSFKVFINGQELVQSRSTKYLGVIIDDKLSWKDHITYLRSKLSRNCYAIGKLKHYVGISTLKLVYYSLFYSYLQYCITSWGGAAKSNLDPLNKVHKRVVRYISQMPALSPTNPLFSQLKFLKLADIHKFQVAKLMFKYKGGNKIGEFKALHLGSRHSYNTRAAGNSNYVIPQVKTNIGLRSFSFLGPKVWQSVPTQFKSISFHSFKHKYKAFLLDQYITMNK